MAETFLTITFTKLNIVGINDLAQIKVGLNRFLRFFLSLFPSSWDRFGRHLTFSSISELN